MGGAHRSADGSRPRCGPQGGAIAVWSAATYANVPEADGFVYQSRFTGHTCMAVFDRAAGKLAVRDMTRLVQHRKFADVLIDYEITLCRTEK